MQRIRPRAGGALRRRTAALAGGAQADAAVAGVAAPADHGVLPRGADPHLPGAGVLHPLRLDGADAAGRRPGAGQQGRLRRARTRRGEVVVFRGRTAGRRRSARTRTPVSSPSSAAPSATSSGSAARARRTSSSGSSAVPGDRVECCDEQGRVTVNGQPLDEPYVPADSPLDVAAQRPGVPVAPVRRGGRRPGQLFVMGDHRLVSQDSRCQGHGADGERRRPRLRRRLAHGRLEPLPVPETFDQVPDAASLRHGRPAGAGADSPAGCAGSCRPGGRGSRVRCSAVMRGNVGSCRD